METNSQKKHILHIHRMHCQACVALTENELSEHPRVSSVKSILSNRTVEIYGDFGDLTSEAIAQELSQLLSQHQLSTTAEKKVVRWQEFIIAAPIAVGIMALFVILQKLGIVNVIDASKMTTGTAFVIGVIASLSSCMAVVGGLVLSMSATFAREGDRVKPQMVFHVSRVASFFILGGLIGIVGSAFQLGLVGTFVISLIIGIVMLLLGINLLDIFHWTKKLQPSLPSFISKRAHHITKINHALTPALLGVATFFLPCGFTQSMQIYTLSTGGFISGGVTMLSFALGTFPALALVSFSSLSIQNRAKAGIFFKSAGLIVIMFAIFNIINSLVAIGLINPIFNF